MEVRAGDETENYAIVILLWYIYNFFSFNMRRQDFKTDEEYDAYLEAREDMSKKQPVF